MFFRQIFDETLAQYAYLIGCQQTGEALVVDPERDIDRYVRIAAAEGLRITAVAETHIHADFLSGARELAETLGARLYLSDEGDENWKYEWARHGGYEVRFLSDGDVFHVGRIAIEAVHTPGHTPEHLSFLVTDEGGGAGDPIGILTGDFVFVGDVGRPDLLERAAGFEGVMEPSARRLHGSIQRFLELSDYMQVWPAHGAGSACGKALGAVPQSTVGYEKRFNASLDFARRGETPFVDFILDGQPEPPLYFARMKRDNKLGVPLLGEVPEPREIAPRELADLALRDDVFVLDLRREPGAFMARHLPRSIHAPLNTRFPTGVGSLVPEGASIYLVASEDEVETGVRALVRIGYDRVLGFTDPARLDAYFEEGGVSAAIPALHFGEVAEATVGGAGRPLDVRFASEYRSGHVPGAVHAPYTRLPELLDELPTDRPLLVYCGTGGRAAIAASFLAREGFDVRHVDDLWARYASERKVVREESALA